MDWLNKLLSNAPGTPALHAVVILLCIPGFLAIALYQIETIDPVTYCYCVGILATAAGGSALAASGAARIENGKPVAPPCEAPKAPTP